MGDFNLKNNKKIGHTIMLIEAMPELYEASQQSALKKALKSILPLFFEGLEKVILDLLRIIMAVLKVHPPGFHAVCAARFDGTSLYPLRTDCSMYFCGCAGIYFPSSKAKRPILALRSNRFFYLHSFLCNSNDNR